MFSKELMSYLNKYSEELEVIKKEENTQKEISFKTTPCIKPAYATVVIRNK